MIKPKEHRKGQRMLREIEQARGAQGKPQKLGGNQRLLRRMNEEKLMRSWEY